MTQGAMRFRAAAVLACAALLMACLAVVAAPAQKAYAAATKYPVFVSGVQVTSSNANDVLGDGTVSFSTSHDSANVPNTLTLKNATITPADITFGSDSLSACGIYLGAGANTNIVLQGTNKIGTHPLEGGKAAQFGIHSKEFFSIRQLQGASGSLDILVANNGGYGYGLDCWGRFQLVSGTVKIMGLSPYHTHGLRLDDVSATIPSVVDGTLVIENVQDGVIRVGEAFPAKLRVGASGDLRVTTGAGFCFNNVTLVYAGGPVQAATQDGLVFRRLSGEIALVKDDGGVILASTYASGAVPTYYNEQRADQYRWLKIGFGVATDIYLGQTPVTSLNADDIFNCGSGARFEFGTDGPGTLYLTDVNFLNVNYSPDVIGAISAGVYRQMEDDVPMADDLVAGMYVSVPINVVLSGDNRINIPGDQLNHLYGVYCAPGTDVKFTSSNGGTLQIDASMNLGGSVNGIFAGGALTIEGDAVVNVDAEGGYDSVSGVFCVGALVVKDRAQLTAEAQCADESAYYSTSVGVRADGSMWVADDATLIGSAVGANYNSAGIMYVGSGSVVFEGARVAGVVENPSSDTHAVPTGDTSAGIYVDCMADSGYASLVAIKGTVAATVLGYDGTIPAFGNVPYFGAGYAPTIRFGSSSTSYSLGDKNTVTGNWYRRPYVEFTGGAYATEYLPAENMWRVVFAGYVSPGHVPSYIGFPMFRDPVRHEWVTLVVSTDVPVINAADFVISSGTKTVLAKPDVKGDSEFGYSGVEGDLNGNYKVNIVDAQIAYDCATGKSALGFTAEGKKRLLMADVNSDGFLDAADALNIAHAALSGGYSAS